MNKDKIIKFTSLIFTISLLVGCNNGWKKFDQDTPVVFTTSTETTLYNLTLTFFDNNKNVPYISMEHLAPCLDWQNNILVDGIYEFSQSGRVFTFTNTLYDNATLTIDFDKDSYTYSDYNSFLGVNPIGIDPIESYTSCEETTIGLQTHYDNYTKGESLTGYFADYNITPINFDDVDYIPFQIAVDLVKNSYMSCLVYNGKSIRILLPENESDVEQFRNEWCINGNDKKFLQYAYQELCFSLHLWHGYRQFLGITNYMDYCEEIGLADEFNKSAHDFNVATFKLFNDYLYDGGHTAATYVPVYSEGINFSDYYPPARVTVDRIKYQEARYNAGLAGESSPSGGIYPLKSDSIIVPYDSNGERLELVKTMYEKYKLPTETDTIFFTFDDFDIYSASSVTQILEMASLSTCNLKNIVFDISLNTGGAVYVLNFLFTLMNGYCEYASYNSITKALSKIKCSVDLSRDNEFDNDTLSTFYNCNFYIITTKNSFSCANAFPCIAKRGKLVKTIGSKTGGGTCVVFNATTCLGALLRMSGTTMLGTIENGEFKHLEDGAEPDFALNDYDDYYNRANIIKNIINK